MSRHDRLNPIPMGTRHLICAAAVVVMTSLPAHAGPNDVVADPMRPPAALDLLTVKNTPVAPPVDLELRSILTSKGRRIAIINNQRLHEGDSIGDSQIARIEADRVYIDRLGKEIVLSIRRFRIKQGEMAPTTSTPWIGPPAPAALGQSATRPNLDAGPSAPAPSPQTSNEDRKSEIDESAAGPATASAPQRGNSK